MNHNRFLANLNRRNTTVMGLEEEPALPSASRRVCQRCKRFEVDLTNASDNLTATDAELKASRQVISLLQRQLELFQVEKEGLEKLIISQSDNFIDCPKDHPSSQSNDGVTQDTDICPEIGNLINLESSGEHQDSQACIQKQLLSLIKTQLYSKDEEIVKLKFNLKEAQNAKEQMNVQVHQLEDDLAKLRLENSVLRENLALRDQTIVSLSNEVFEQTGGDVYAPDKAHNNRRQSSAETLLNQTANHFRQTNSEQHYQRQISKMNDTLEAYKKTNELLSQNVLKLTEKCAQSERREMESKSQAQELEARCCQIQSKLLSLLKEIEQSTTKQTVTTRDSETSQSQCNEFIQSEPVKLLIKRLLEDKSLDIPLSWKEGNKSKNKIVNRKSGDSGGELECDELGFYIVPGATMNNSNESSSPNHSSPVGSIIHARTRRARPLKRGVSEGGVLLGPVEEVNEVVDYLQHHSVDSAKNDETNWRLNWDEFIKDFDKINLVKSKEFKALLRSGTPQEYRCKIWKALIDLKVGKERQNRGPDYYQSLLEPSNAKSPNSKQQINPSSKQIELDLLRTLPNNKYFETIDSPGTVRLRRVLNAFAAHKPEVGYCQGMNRLAAVALLILPEEEAFWCLVSIVEKIMPSGYYNDLWLAQVDSNVVMDFVVMLMPNLAEHFRRHEIELSLFAWFLTIFVDGTQPAFFLRLWDCFLYEGDKIMFRIALALLKMNEDILINLNSSVAVNNFLRSSVNSSMDIDGVFRVAFESINPLPGSKVRSRRESHFQAMKANMRNYEPSNKSKMVTADDQADSSTRNKSDDGDESPHEESSIISV
uniref:TBC1 domain family member 2A n=2 Tax=Aceria tosichella TaxID=561515 RepID=A0A6G1SM00_9ACAR